jgi:outer membrane receptor protein involved in Fe transport
VPSRYRSLVLAFLASEPALAQPPLEEVLVTAEFRNIPLLEQAASTSIVSAAAIQQHAAQHLQDILNLAPNVNYASGASRARFFQIRGIGERSQFQEPLNPSIGFIIDDIDFSGLGTAGTLFDVQQVEVLRGPQGTLHGANALAGLINIRTEQPAAEPGLRLEGMMADYQTYSAGIVSTGPVVANSLLYRIGVNSYRSDGFYDNVYLDRSDTSNRQETSVRGKLRWLVGDHHTLDLTAMYIDINNGYDAFSLDNNRRTLSDRPGDDRQQSTALGLNWQGNLSLLDVVALASLARSDSEYSYDEDWSFVGIAPGWEYSSFDQYLRDRDSYSAELRLLSNDQSRLLKGRGEWVAGVYYLGNREQLRRRYTYLSDDFRSNFNTDTLAVFGQLDTALTDSLTLITGLRWERRATDYDDSNGVRSKPDKGLWGGRITLEYALGDSHLLYGGLSRGYRANGVNAAILANAATVADPELTQRMRALQTYEEEFLLNYEIGFKGRFLADSLSIRLALFYMDRQDQQVRGSLVLPRDDGSSQFIDYVANAAEGNNYGLELELDWQAGERLAFHAGIGLLATRFEDYINADGVDLSGREQAQAPNYQYALGGRLDLGRGFYLRLDLEGKDDFFFSDRHDVTAPAYDLVHARLGYDLGRWSLALWGRNLTDEDYAVRGFGSFGNDPRKEYAVEPYYQYGDPRLIGISASYRF